LRYFEKQQFVIAAIIVALVGVFLFLQYLPTVKKAKAYEIENKQLIIENAKSGALLEKLPRLFEQIDETLGKVGNFDAKVPQRRSHGSFLQKIADIMQEHNLRELVIEPGSEIESENLSRIPIIISCNGRLEQMFDFFRSLESFERIIHVEHVSFKNSDEYDGEISMRMQADIFYRTR